MESVACDPDGHASPRGTRVPRETGMLPSLLKPLGAVCGSHYPGHGYRREGGKRRRGGREWGGWQGNREARESGKEGGGETEGDGRGGGREGGSGEGGCSSAVLCLPLLFMRLI